MKLRDAIIIDYETLPIDDRPRHPGIPVGVAIGQFGKAKRYYAWGHPSANNATWADARAALGAAYQSGRPLIFHNAKYDVEVGEVHMGLERLPWDRYHDTLPMLFIDDPRAESFALKPSGERLLNMPAEERDAVVDWLMKHQPIQGLKLSDKPNSDHYAGAYVAFAPGDIVGKYAIGDLTRTEKLAELVYPRLIARDMIKPYDRERQLLFPIMEMERQGIRIAVDRLFRDIKKYEEVVKDLEDWLRFRLDAADDLNFDSGAQLAEALIKAKVAKESDFGVTETGKLATNKDALTGAIKDLQVLHALKYRTQLGTCLKTFMRPWYETARWNDGYIFTAWHSTRTDRSDGGVGTKTGRLSSTPNFQNIPKEFTELFAQLKNGELPQMPIMLPPLPLVRSYIIAYDDDHTIIDRDYSQQELRGLAHFEGGQMLEAYKANPWLDFHEMVQTMVNEMLGTNFERKPIKNTNFGLIYGMGVGKLALKNGTDVATAKKVKDAILKIFPGLKEIYAEARRRAEANEPIRTWGGREYYCEEPKLINGRWQKFDYKLPNVLIQGSSADATKEALIRFFAVKAPEDKVMMTVHDEIVVSVEHGRRDRVMKLLREAMESVEFDVPMLSEGSYGDDLQNLKDYDTKGKIVCRLSRS